MKQKHIAIPEDVMDILRASTISGKGLKLPPELERSLYERTNKIIVAAGGKWNRSAQAHIFPSDPTEVLGLAMESGKVLNEKQTYQFFRTPAELARRMVLFAGDIAGKRVLEPSAGDGAIVQAIWNAVAGADNVKITAVELDPARLKELETLRLKQLFANDANFIIHATDFLTMMPAPVFDRVIMNPPFTAGQDMAHIIHAMKFLKKGGRLVGICSNGGKQRWKIKPFCSQWEELPAGTFKESGTGVKAVLLVIDN